MGKQQQQEPRNNRKRTVNNKPNKHKGPPTSTSHKHKKVEIKFNPAKRVEYLTGFSSRKKERRAFGLAMQKVKDRQAKIDERKDNRDARLEKVEEIERSKAALRYDDGDHEEDEEGGGIGETPLHKNQNTFRDEHTTNHFGGYVSVTTTYGILSDDEDDVHADTNNNTTSKNNKQSFFERTKHGKDHVDIQQRQAGNVSSYITKVKGSMNGGKKKRHGGGGASCKKGQHGAASMKGMGSGTTLKMAKKTLAKFKTKGGERERDGGGRGKGKVKKRKGHR